MKNLLKRGICAFLAVIMTFCAVSQIAFAEDFSEVESDSIDGISTYAVDPEKNIEDTIREQVETYAKSIDIENADGKAKDIIVTHGISKGGKKLSVGKGHALTATLFNSELLKTCLTVSIAEIIRTAGRVHEKNMYGHLFSNWKISGNYTYGGRVYDYVTDKYVEGCISNIGSIDYSGKTNSYDSTLELISGNTEVNISVERTKTTKTEATYKVTCTASDRFDFDTSAGLISGFMAFLFKEFDWESKVSFTVKAPYFCYHETENYHWIYDAENHTMNSVSEEGFCASEAKQMVIVNDNGTKVYYHELAEPVNLFHDKPWVMEYTVMNPNYFTLAPAIREQYSYPYLYNMGTNHLFFQDYETIDGKRINNCYGISFSGVIPKDTLYTVTLENVIDANGGNMVYLSIYNETSGKYFYENVPMNDHYYLENGVLDLKSEESDKISGKDFIINYIGNKQYSFSADYFDLSIWENGKDSEPADYYSDETIAPTCEKKGYVLHTCALCGYSYKDTYTAALGHSFGEWETVAEPTEETPGEEQRSCSVCGTTENREIPVIVYYSADINLDGSVNVMDAYFARLAAAKLIEPTEKQLMCGDVDKDGKITAIDANIIRKFVVGIIAELPLAQ